MNSKAQGNCRIKRDIRSGLAFYAFFLRLLRTLGQGPYTVHIIHRQTKAPNEQTCTNLLGNLPHAVYELQEYRRALVIRVILVSVTVTLHKKKHSHQQIADPVGEISAADANLC